MDSGKAASVIKGQNSAKLEIKGQIGKRQAMFVAKLPRWNKFWSELEK